MGFKPDLSSLWVYPCAGLQRVRCQWPGFTSGAQTGEKRRIEPKVLGDPSCRWLLHMEEIGLMPTISTATQIINSSQISWGCSPPPFQRGFESLSGEMRP